jgi:hypothetical protein
MAAKEVLAEIFEINRLKKLIIGSEAFKVRILQPVH